MNRYEVESIRKELENELAHRDAIATGLQEELGNYLMARLKEKEKMKRLFFYITIGILLVSLGFVGFLLVRITNQPLNGNLEGIAAFVTAVVGGITALLALPNIIANFLFNKKEDEKITEFISDTASRNFSELDKLLPDEKMNSFPPDE